jgi:hypothetical protein
MVAKHSSVVQLFRNTILFVNTMAIVMWIKMLDVLAGIAGYMKKTNSKNSTKNKCNVRYLDFKNVLPSEWTPELFKMTETGKP